MRRRNDEGMGTEVDVAPRPGLRPRSPFPAALLAGWAVFLFLSPGACGGGPEAKGFLVRDSAGVTIAESRSPTWEEGDGWTVEPEATVRIGRVGGEEAYQFDGVTGMARLPDGTIVVADGGSQQIRFFNPDGTFRNAFGGPGEGPGEFTGLSAMGLGPVGRVWAYDFMLRRLTWLDASGVMAELNTLPPAPPMLNPVGPLPGGSFLLKQLWAAEAVAQATEEGLRRDPVALVAFDTREETVDTLGLFPGREVYIAQEEGRGVMGTPLLGHNVVATPWGGGVAVGTQDEFRITRYGPEGEATLVARIPGWDTTPTPQDLEAAMDARLAHVPEDRRAAARRNIESMPTSPSKPAHGSLMADQTGHLWISAWSTYPRVPASWTILDPGGVWLGTVRTPEGFFPYAIGEDWVLGVETDELDVEYVALYPLHRG